ncbi:MAG: carbon storage regulator CsrA [Candidatus Neomarinimicrobiota bacterium]
MLILTRRIGESIMIGDNIEVVVSNIRGRQAQVSIDAPNEVKIYRKEIYQKIQAQQEIQDDMVGRED